MATIYPPYIIERSSRGERTYDIFSRLLMDRIIFRVIPEQASLFAGVKSGDLDMATINDGAIIRQAAKDSKVVVMSKPGLNMRIFSFNTSRKPFDDVRVRQAFALALGRDEIIATAEFGSAMASGPLPVAVAQWALPPAKLPFPTQDFAKAKKLLKEAVKEGLGEAFAPGHSAAQGHFDLLGEDAIELDEGVVHCVAAAGDGFSRGVAVYVCRGGPCGVFSR